MDLTTFFKKYPKVALAFSGGTDSSYLLYAALQSGADVRPYFIRTALQPDFEWADAQSLASRLGVDISQIELDILALPGITANPPDRCYECKTALFSALKKQAELDGYPVIIDGTNASDDASDRPGMLALAELGVLSPLRLCGIGKQDVRRLSREAGLPTWSKPAYACLATRIPTGEAITADLLRRVEKAEEQLFQIGFSDFRVRVYANAARIQLQPGQMAQAVAQREEIRQRLEPYFQIVLLDLAAR